MILQWNAVALWAWDIVVDNCAICRNHIMDLCKPCPLAVSGIVDGFLQASNVKPIKGLQRMRSALSHGVSAM